MGQKVAAQTKIDPGELKAMWEAGTPMTVIAERFGVTPSSVSKRGRALGLRPIGFVQRDLKRAGKGTV